MIEEIKNIILNLQDARAGNPITVRSAVVHVSNLLFKHKLIGEEEMFESTRLIRHDANLMAALALVPKEVNQCWQVDQSAKGPPLHTWEITREQYKSYPLMGTSERTCPVLALLEAICAFHACEAQRNLCGSG